MSQKKGIQQHSRDANAFAMAMREKRVNQAVESQRIARALANDSPPPFQPFPPGSVKLSKRSLGW